MLTPEDIKLLVTSGEGFNVEFKLTVPSKVRELTEEVCAFANAAGGVLLIGVNDANKIIGVTIDNAKRSAIQHSLGDISPHLTCSLYLVEVDNKTVGVIEVPSGPGKPYVFSGAIYVRIGPNTQKLTTADQMRGFFQQSAKIYFDEVPCTGFDPSVMLDMDFLRLFKGEARISSSVPDEQIFDSLRLYSEGRVFKNGAALFFGKNPENLMEAAITRGVAFQGTDKRYIIDDQFFGGNLFNQYRQAMQWLRGKLNVRYDIEGQGSGPRKEIWEIPETVFREAIINALSHRDYYERGAVTNIEVFDDRVEITNPGGLVSAIPESEFGRRSHSRNPLIFGLFSKMHLVEQVGSGVGRIKEAMKDAGLAEPVFWKEGMFILTLSRPSGTTRKSDRTSDWETDTKILDLMKKYPEITADEIAGKIRITSRTVKRHLVKLKKDGRIVRIGPKKTGHWSVLNGPESGED